MPCTTKAMSQAMTHCTMTMAAAYLPPSSPFTVIIDMMQGV